MFDWFTNCKTSVVCLQYPIPWAAVIGPSTNSGNRYSAIRYILIDSLFPCQFLLKLSFFLIFIMDALSLRTLCIAKLVNEGWTQADIDRSMGGSGVLRCYTDVEVFHDRWAHQFDPNYFQDMSWKPEEDHDGVWQPEKPTGNDGSVLMMIVVFYLLFVVWFVLC